MAAAAMKGVFLQVSIGVLGAAAELTAAKIEEKLQQKGVALYKDWEARKPQEAQRRTDFLKKCSNSPETPDDLQYFDSEQQIETQKRGFDIVNVAYNEFRKVLEDLLYEKVQQTELRAKLLGTVSIPWVTAQLASIFPPTVNGWEYFHWVVAQELTYHDPVTEINEVLYGVKRRVPELEQHLAQNPSDLFKYVLVNSGSKEKMIDLMKVGGLSMALSAIYTEYSDVTARLRQYLTPFPHPLV